jgi:sporulation integral membrane protein YtvI
MFEKLKERKWAKISLIAIAFIIIFSVLNLYLTNIIGFLFPFILIVTFSLILNKPVDYLEKKKVPRWLGTILSLLIFLSILIGIVVGAVIQLIIGSKILLELLNKNSEKIIDIINNFYEKNVLPIMNSVRESFSSLNVDQKDTLQEKAIEMGQNILGQTVSFIQKFLEIIPVILTALPSIFAGLIFVSLATFFLTKDFHIIKKKIEGKLTEERIKKLKIINNEIKKTVLGFAKAQLTLITITFVIVLIGLFIIGVKYTFLLALIIGLVDILPYIGTGIIFIPWIVGSFIVGDTKVGISLTILYVLVVVQRNIMEPKILSNNIGLDPLSTLLAIYLGFYFFGFLGLIIGPIFLLIGKMVYNIYFTQKNNT